MILLMPNFKVRVNIHFFPKKILSNSEKNVKKQIFLKVLPKDHFLKGLNHNLSPWIVLSVCFYHLCYTIEENRWEICILERLIEGYFNKYTILNIFTSKWPKIGLELIFWILKFVIKILKTNLMHSRAFQEVSSMKLRVPLRAYLKNVIFFIFEGL